MPRGKGKRCHGFLSGDGLFAHCSRQEYAGNLKPDPNGQTYPHRLDGSCECGKNHGPVFPASTVKPTGEKPIQTKAYPYQDEKGNLLFEVCRFKPKGFKQRRPDGNGGHIWDMNGVRRVLYRLPELIQADKSQPIFIVEGEKDADALRAFGLLATTAPQGAGKWNLVQEDARRLLAGRDVVIISDNDEPGQKRVADVAASLHGAARSVKIVPLPGLPEKGDVSDWLASGGTADELRRLVELAPEYEPPPASAMPVITAPGGAESTIPIPLERETEPPETYPLEALGPILSPAAQAVQRYTQAPAAIVGNSILAAAALCVQPFVDVLIRGDKRPSSLFFLTIGESGERKSTVDTLALFEHRRWQEERMREYKRARQEFDDERTIWEKARSEALSSKNKERFLRKESLNEIGPEPLPPRKPFLIFSEPTFEGLCRLFEEAIPALGLFSDEGGRFLGGYAMSDENQTKTAAGLSELWGGGTISRVRAKDGAHYMAGRRLSIHLMLQRRIAQAFLSNATLGDQGFLSRFLPAFPASRIGERLINPDEMRKNIHDDPAFRRYCSRVRDLLESSWPIREETTEELQPWTIRLEQKAESLWIGFHNRIETAMGEGGPLQSIRSMANKAPENVLRVAAVIEVFHKPDAEMITNETLESAIRIIIHHTNEAIRLFECAQDDPDLDLARRTMAWIFRNIELPGEAIRLKDIYQGGSRAIRFARRARVIVSILVSHGFLLQAVTGGGDIKDAWIINPSILSDEIDPTIYGKELENAIKVFRQKGGVKAA
ncbi:MAG: DUF3987 domain-containing protein [Candidatus Omnitrophota bacterium]